MNDKTDEEIKVERANDVESYFSLSKRNSFGILRVDDKDITTDSSILSATVRW